jgi:TP53 regulating kinase-like protein
MQCIQPMDSDMPNAKEPRMEVDECDDNDGAIATEYSYHKESTPFQQGAEAKVFRCTYLGRKAVIKERFVKEYRHPKLDEVLTKERLRNELKGILKCKEIGLDVPAVYFINRIKHEMICEYIPGELSARNYIEQVLRPKCDADEFKRLLCEFGERLGKVIGRLHGADFIHGDLTTSNVLLRDGDPTTVVLIDFGLSQNVAKAEDKAVDLYVLERAIRSTHHAVDFFPEAILLGYKEALSQKQYKQVMLKLDEVRLRGRKRDMIG